MKKKFTFVVLTLLLGLFSWNASAQTEVTVAGSASGNGNYATLAEAIAAIPLTEQTGNNITVAISAGTTETSTITIGNGDWATLKIYPTANTLTCTEVNIALSGAKNVTIDGRVNATGSPAVGATTSLTLSSTSSTNPVISFDNDAQSNTVKYCTIKIGELPNTTGGIAFGSNAGTTNGNGNNVIDHNLITSSGAIYPFYAIYATGNTSNPNKGNQITNNEFTNFMKVGPVSGGPAGIYISGNATANINDNYTISGNSMYGDIATNAGGNRYFIQIGDLGNGGSHTVSGNYIGGSSANCGGSKMTKNGTVVSNFTGISLTTSATGTSLVQNNRIKNISWTTAAGTQNFTGITVSGTGDATISGNSIGDNSTSGYSTTASIIHTIMGTTAASFNGISISTTGTVTCDQNQIGSIKTGNAGTGGTGAVTFNGISKSAAGTTTISNNTIGSLTAPYSINDSINNSTLYNQNVNSINFTGTGSSTVENNTIANISNRASGGTTYGIQMNGVGSNNTVNANLIHSISVIGATTHIILGISSSNGTNLITNNIIKLGDDYPIQIRGIADATNSVSTSGYHNTVYVSGNPASGGAINSACLFSGAATKIRNYKNNIFVNTRSNSDVSATGTHYAVNITAKSGAGTISVNGNDYFVSGTGTVLGTYGGNKTSLPIVTSNDGSSLIENPTFANAGGTNAEDFRATNTSLTGVTGTSVTTDYAGDIHIGTPKMGAFFIPTIVPVNSNKSISELIRTTVSQIEVAAGFELTLDETPAESISKIILAPTAKLTMGAHTITTTNGVVFQSDANGTATITGDLAVSNATVQQYVSAGRNWYISPSVSVGTASMLSLGDSVVVWNEVSKIWEKVTSSLIAGRGYIQTAASGHGTTGTVNFTGTTNNGDITTPSLTRTGLLATSGFNLVGNPYPSYLRWSGLNSVLSDANNSEIGTSFWYRTKNDADAYIFVTHNGTSGYTIPVDQNANTTITGIIPPMQAFWVRVTGTTTMKFTNVMRLHTDNALNKFKAPKIDERQRLRLQLVNGSATDEALIYFDAAASNSFDNYDSPKMLNNSTTIPDLYSKAGNEKLVINGLAEATDNMTLPLGFTLKTAVNGLTFKVSELSNFAIGTKVYLIDNELNNQTELLPETQYTFNTTTATSNNENRFSLLFRAPGVTTGVGKTSKPYAQVFVNAANQIVIIAPVKSNYAIYNAMGQLMENGVLNTERETRNMKLNSGVYVVKVNNQSTKVIIK